MATEKRLSPKDYDKLLKVIAQIYEIKSPDDLQKKILTSLHQLIPSDYVSFNRFNPSVFQSRDNDQTARSHSEFQTFPVVTVPLGALYKYAHQHPTITFFKKTLNGKPHNLSDFLNKTSFHRLGLYNEYYRPLGVEYQILFWLSTQPDKLTAINLNRSIRNFSEGDRLMLTLLRPHLLRAYKNAAINTRFHHERKLLEDTIEQEGRGIIQVDWDGKIQFITAFARFLLTTYFNAVSQSRRLPLPLQKWLESLSSSGRRSSDNRPLVLVSGGKELFIQCLQADGYEHPILLLKEVDSFCPDVRSAEALGLSQRESEVLHWLAMGKTNQEISLILDIRIGTVKKHLEHIYPKLGVETRTAAASVYQSLSSNH